MLICLITDVFPPLRSSGAVQLRDLAAQLALDGHQVTVITPSSDLNEPWDLQIGGDGIRVLRIKSPVTKDISFIRRVLGEILLGFSMRSGIAKSPLQAETWQGIIWYSPTIFLGPFVAGEVKRTRAPTYLILRDIFPEWLVDVGLLKKGPIYLFFKFFEHFQYRLADTIGVQSETNFKYFTKWEKSANRRVEVLQNWLAPAADIGCSIDLSKSCLAGRRILVYAGNMGKPQGIIRLSALCEGLRSRPDIGIVFVGRGTEYTALRQAIVRAKLTNTLFFDEIDPNEIPGLYAQAHVGIVALDPRHRANNNLPGKFLSYMQAGLPVLATVNAGNDLIDTITSNGVGAVTYEDNPDGLAPLAIQLLDTIEADPAAIRRRCIELNARLFSPLVASHQITKALGIC